MTIAHFPDMHPISAEARAFAVTLRRYRIESQWSQEYCAMTCGVNVATWKRWEHRRLPRIPSELKRVPVLKLFPALSVLLNATICD